MTDKKQLLFVVHQMNVGGVQKALLSALDAIDYDEYDVTLYVRKNRRELLPRVNARVGKIIVNEDAARYYRRPKAIALHLLGRLAKLCGGSGERWEERLKQYVIDAGMRYEKANYFSDGKRYDIAVSYIQGYTAWFTARYVDADKKIMFFHGSTDEHNALHHEIMCAFDRIVAVNEGCQTMLQTTYPEYADKIIYIENYVDGDLIRAEAEKETVDRQNAAVVLCTCGRMTPVKGFDLAVAAAQRLKEQGLDFLWYFVGDGPERENLERQIREAGLEDNITITGMLENPYPYIAGCDIYVQPSREESYGLAITEAQILRRPVISTDTVGGKSLVRDGENGLLAAIDGESLAEKIWLLANDSALWERISSNRRQTDESKRKKEYADKWKALLTES